MIESGHDQEGGDKGRMSVARILLLFRWKWEEVLIQ
jgi:hypothetical protein